MRFRTKLALWLLNRLGPHEVFAVTSRNLGRLDSFLLTVIAGQAVRGMSNADRKVVWHDLGLNLNVAKDGTLDLGRTKEGSQP